MTHFMNDDMMTYISFLKKQCEGIMDFWLLFDTCNGDFELENENDLNICRFNHSTDFEESDWTFNNKFSNNPLCIYNFFYKEHNYEHYLFIENDIFLNGDFRKFVKKINISQEDYIHIKYRLHEEDSIEHHFMWNYMNKKDFGDNNIKFYFHQIFYISHDLLSDIIKYNNKNNTLFFEFLIPTIAYNGDYRIKYFEDFGYSFSSNTYDEEKYEKEYINSTEIDRFYHPVKNVSLFNDRNDLKPDIKYHNIHTTYICYHKKNDNYDDGDPNTIWFYGPSDKLNRYFSEFSMLYWIWKNDKKSKYITTCHYRRRIFESEFDEKLVNNNSCQVHNVFNMDYTIKNFFTNYIKCDWLFSDYKDYIYEKYNLEINNEYNSKYFVSHTCYTLNRYHFMKMCDYVFGFIDYLNTKYNLNYDEEKFDIFTKEITKKGFIYKNLEYRCLAYMLELLCGIYIYKNIKNINIINENYGDRENAINFKDGTIIDKTKISIPNKDNFKTCVLSLFRNEEKYLDEWVNHNLNLGFDKIFIIDNNDSNNKLIYNNDKVVILPYNDINFADYTKGTISLYKCNAYNYGLSYIKNLDYNYVAVIDNDEFFNFKTYKTVKDFIWKEMIEKKINMVNIPWEIYDDNDIIYESDVKDNVANTYTRIAKKVELDDKESCKSIFKLSKNVSYKYNIYYPDNNEYHFNLIPSNISVLKHYRFKSLEEFIKIKCLKNHCCANENHRNNIFRYYFTYNTFSIEKIISFKKILNENGIYHFDNLFKKLNKTFVQEIKKW